MLPRNKLKQGHRHFVMCRNVLVFNSLRSWRYCVLVELDLAAERLYQSSEIWQRSGCTSRVRFGGGEAVPVELDLAAERLYQSSEIWRRSGCTSRVRFGGGAAVPVE